MLKTVRIIPPLTNLFIIDLLSKSLPKYTVKLRKETGSSRMVLESVEAYLVNSGGGEFRQSRTTVFETICKATTPLKPVSTRANGPKQYISAQML